MGRLRDPQIRPRLGLQGRFGRRCAQCQERHCKSNAKSRQQSAKNCEHIGSFRRGGPETLAFPFKSIKGLNERGRRPPASSHKGQSLPLHFHFADEELAVLAGTKIPKGSIVTISVKALNGTE